MKRPSRVKIMAFNYRISGLSVSDCMGFGVEGMHKPDLMEIAIADHLCPARQAHVLLHEMIHALYFCMGMRQEAMPEEEVAEYISNGLMLLWRDNPRVFAWINEAIMAQDEEGDEDDEDDDKYDEIGDEDE